MMRRNSPAQVGDYRAQLLRFARQRLRNPAHAEDAVQDTLVAALEGIDRYAGEASMGSWLTGILKHKIVDCVRRTAGEESAPIDVDTLPGSAPDPEQAAHGSRILAHLDRHLAELPAKAAQVFVLRDVFGMNTAEACGALAISTANCAVLLHRARRRLRERLVSDCIRIAA